MMSNRKASCLLVIAVVVAGMSVPATAARTQIWDWSFLKCIFCDTCFYKVYRYCRSQNRQELGAFVCVAIALDWCEPTHFNGEANRCKIPGDPCFDEDNRW